MFSTFGFSGSRSSVSACALVSAFLPSVPSSAAVLVGCASGVDAVVRAAFPSASVFAVQGFGRGAFAARSVRFVRALSASPSPVLVCVPSGACPVGLVPSASPFSGFGSGSWASAALAVYLGIPIVFLGVSVPASWLRFGSVVGGVFVPSPSVQASLF